VFSSVSHMSISLMPGLMTVRMYLRTCGVAIVQ
jgi:hypothetical protein